MTEVLSSPAMLGIDTEDFAFQHQASSPHSLKETELDPFSSPPAPPLQNHQFNFPSTIYDESSASNTDHEADYVTEAEDGTLPRAGAESAATTSSRSSISSFPGSIMPVNGYGHEDLEKEQAAILHNTRTKSPRILHHHRSGSLGYKIKSPVHADPSGSKSPVREYGNREYSPAFRNPSSVRAMQMRDEGPFDENPRSLSGHRRRGSRMSVYSHCSANSTQTSPTKRKSSPLKSALKTEFPLVLLHCTLLPPTLGALTLPLSSHIQLSSSDEEAVLKEVLPDPYWQRWRILKEKVERNVEVRTRGVLISHPRADYEILEERLLESLELETGRVREGHYFRRDEDDEVTPADSAEDAENELDEAADAISSKTKCPDCGKKVSVGMEVEKKWEVKVYAANGLMRAGAWSAAWGEMEKVDVEVGVWMPESVRREVEESLAGMGLSGHSEDVGGENQVDEVEDEEERRRREIYGLDEGAGHDHEHMDGMFETADRHHPDQEHHSVPSSYHQPQNSLQDLILNYLKVQAQDRQNVLIVFLSILILFYAINNSSSRSTESPLSLAVSSSGIEAAQVEYVTMTVTSTSISTSTAVSVSTTTILESLATSSALPLEDSLSIEHGIGGDGTQGTSADFPDPEDEYLTKELEKEGLEEAKEEQAPSVAETIVDMLVGDGDVLVD